MTDARLLARLNAALVADPCDGGAWSTLGLLPRRAGKLVSATACHRRGLEFAPENASIWSNLSNALTESGRLEEGAVWDGAPLEGGTVVLSAEQGFADALLMARIVALVKERGGRVLYEISGGHTLWCPTMRLFRQDRDLGWTAVAARVRDAFRSLARHHSRGARGC